MDWISDVCSSDLIDFYDEEKVDSNGFYEREGIDSDINRDGNPQGSKRLFAVLWDEKNGDVWVDTNQDLSFADEEVLGNFADRPQFGVFGHDDANTPVRDRKSGVEGKGGAVWTGFQTCALPISSTFTMRRRSIPMGSMKEKASTVTSIGMAIRKARSACSPCFGMRRTAMCGSIPIRI